MRLKLIIVLCAIGMMPLAVAIADAPTTAPASATTSAVTPTVAVVPAPVVTATPVAVTLATDGMVTLDFQDADIRNVLKVLSYKSGVNIVISPEVAGNVTIQLNDVPWLKALEVILSTYGYGYERKGNIITVTTIENLKKRREDAKVLEEQEPLVTKTYSLSYAKASDVVDSIGKIKSSRGTINFDQRTNSIIVRDVQNAIDLMDGVVKTVDSVTPQVMIEAKIIETTLSDTDKLGIDWTATATALGSANKINLPASSLLAGSGFSYGTLDFSAFKAVLNMLSTRSDTHILSNPKIVTLDNQPAKINVGTQFPLPNYTWSTETNKLQVSGFAYKDIGIIFEVTPHVNNAGMVTLDLHPTISSHQTGNDVVFDTTTLPIITIEEASTKVMVGDAQTLVIAGLIKDQTDLSKSKFPILGDIPLLNLAFKNKTTTKTKTELLIFLTPHIITAQKPASAAPATTPATNQ